MSFLIKLKSLTAIRFFMIGMPVMVPYFQGHQLNLSDIFILQSVFAIMVVIFEVPSGYWSDVWSRKGLLVASAFATVAAVTCFCFWTTFAGFVVAETAFALAFALFSGSDSAYLYEWMQRKGTANHYPEQEGRLQGFARISEAVASLFGGAVASISLFVPFLVWLLVSLCAIPISICLPRSEKQAQQGQSLIGHCHQFRVRLIGLLSPSRRGLLYLYAISAVLSTMILGFLWLLQPYMLAQHVPLYWFGVIWAGYYFCAGLFSKRFSIFYEWFGRGLFFWVAIIVVLSLLGFAWFHSVWILGLGLLIEAMFGLKMPLVFSLINAQVDDEVRATYLSMDSTMTRLLFAITAPFIGWIATYSLSWAFGGLALVGGVLLAILIPIFLKSATI